MKKLLPVCGMVSRSHYDDTDKYTWELSADQMEMNEAFRLMMPFKKKPTVLHVGIGASSVAERFYKQCLRIEGITLRQDELFQAQAMSIPNYYPVMCNKYGDDFRFKIGRGFDVVFENNPATYTCCRVHYVGYLSRLFDKMMLDGVMLSYVDGVTFMQDGSKYTVDDFKADLKFFHREVTQPYAQFPKILLIVSR